ncbi:carbohydrate-binding X8 domain superfamily protein [Striga asiatica]|uniref:Carbohydrate-binding X8 domain superfamily protein n=1 Tax=Striga asiatica TaxID=4170 RepID=A0A5A7QF08_STRAF|nr:carbohydrate-binding X8 domain superfamily protein [Striga asiatica]
MADFFVGFLLILAMAGYSDANYCVCNPNLSDNVLQKSIDYACGNGADCTPIQQNGRCYNPNTVKDHCNYAVNSYYQIKGQTQGSCDFSGTATISANPPTTITGCVFPSGPSTGGTPTIGTPTAGGTPATGTPVSGGTPTTGTPISGGTPTFGTPPTGGTPATGGSPNMGGTTIPGSTASPGFGLGPTTSSGFPSPDINNGAKLLSESRSFTLVSIFVVLISSFICLRM